MTNNYNTQESVRVPVILNWLDWDGLRFIDTLNDEEQVKYRTSTKLFKVLGDTFKPEHNEITTSLQYFKLAWQQSKNADEWIGHLRIKTMNVI